MRTFSLADVEVNYPDTPRHLWTEDEKKPENTDTVTLRHKPSGSEVVLNGRDFGAHTLGIGLADLISQASRQK